MAFRALALCFLMVSPMALASGRRPAVEDFVGIEVEQPEATPYGSEVLYNLEQDLNKIEEQKHGTAPKISAAPAQLSPGTNFTTIVALSFIVALPLLMWAMIMSHLKRKAKQENASNIELLEKYRKEREKKSEESVKKAS